MGIKQITMAGQYLRTIEQVPGTFREVHILSGYRQPGSSPWKCVTSVFERTNETLNFWTHFIPSIFFWWQTINLWPSLVKEGPYAHPMMIVLISNSTFLTMSCIAHIFNTMSDRVRHICFFMDYMAIGFHVLCSGIAYRAYAFPSYMINTLYSDVYVHIAASFSVISLIMSCHSRFLPIGFYKKITRMTAFMVPYFFVSAPLMSRVIYCESDECLLSSLLPLKSHFFFSFLSAFLFASHVPECLYPGKFDIVGHSHQLFHICSVIASYLQVVGLHRDMMKRKEFIKESDSTQTLGTTFSLVSVVLFQSVGIIAYFIQKLQTITSEKIEDNCEQKNGHSFNSSCNNNSFKVSQRFTRKCNGNHESINENHK